MNRVETERQKSMQMELPLREPGEVPVILGSVEELTMKHETTNSINDQLMERVVEKTNMTKAYKRVKRNKGAAGIDGMTVAELKSCLVKNWKTIREELLDGSYQPKPVMRIEIPKPPRGVRQLGIPTVIDRLIEQAILQILQPIFDPTFSDHSHGFRPERSAHGAIREAQRYIQSGKRWVVDLDLEKFFDRVNHDVLMSRLARRIGDKRILTIIRRYLEAGVMVNGVIMERWEGTPQGGPLSPLLANVLLDEVDKELEGRGHTFVRYADDCNIYVRSEKAAKRVMESMKREYAKLKLKVNEEKSAVQRAWDSKFLGYTFWRNGYGRVKIRVAKASIEKMKSRVRELTIRRGGRSLGQIANDLKSYLPGWKSYFNEAEVRGIFAELDKWIRHRLRVVQLKQWRCGTTAYREIRKLGHGRDVAAMASDYRKGWWGAAKGRAVNIVMPKSYFDYLGVPRLAC
jgi:RNA-directed DNA polymerase